MVNKTQMKQNRKHHKLIHNRQHGTSRRLTFRRPNVKFEPLIFKLCTYHFRPTDRPCQQVVNIVVFIQIKCYSSLRQCWLWILKIVVQYSWRKCQWGRLCYKTFSKEDTCFSMGLFPWTNCARRRNSIAGCLGQNFHRSLLNLISTVWVHFSQGFGEDIE